MTNFTINFIEPIKQMTFTAPTCKVEINFHVGGTRIDIDLVQVYAIPAGQGSPSAGLGNVVDSVDLGDAADGPDYSSVPDLPAGTAFTIGLCPRSKTDGTLDDQIDDQYWETFCIFQPFTTTLNFGPGAPQVTVNSIQPYTLKNPNQITISWSGSDYTDGQVLWGPLNNAMEYTYSFVPVDVGNEPSYQGSNSFPIPPVLQGKILSFTVRVRNQFNDATLWFPTTIGVQSARNYHSVRQFLQASDVKLPAQVRHSPSLRALMQI
jgi:hypothetical protein